jgi:hypothetical protein
MQNQVLRNDRRIHPRAMEVIDNFDVERYREDPRTKMRVHDDRAAQIALDRAAQLGIIIEMPRLKRTMDAIQGLVTTPSIGTPIQFLQTWMPGYVYVQTGVRAIDEFVGMSIIGSFWTEEIVQGILERSAIAQPYVDYGNLPLASFNTNFVRRSVVRFMQGAEVGRLEEMQSAQINIDVAATKRSAVAQQLEIQRNNVGFSGYNAGANRTYGFLNEPGLPSYVTVATGAASSTQWPNKTVLETIADIRTSVSALRTQSQGMIDPKKIRTTLAVPTNRIDYLTVVSDFGFSVLSWLKDNYPLMRVISAPQLNNANSNANVFYLYAEDISDESTDDSRVWAQMVPAKSYMLGVMQGVKSYIEGIASATAGLMLKRPWAVVRYTGI